MVQTLQNGTALKILTKEIIGKKLFKHINLYLGSIIIYEHMDLYVFLMSHDMSEV